MSAPPETDTPLTPKEEAHVSKSVRLNIIEEDGPPSPSVVKPEISDEPVFVKSELAQPVETSSQSAACAAQSKPPITFASLHAYEPVFSVMRNHSYVEERDPSTVGTDVTFVRQVRAGMFDYDFTALGSDIGPAGQDGKLEAGLDSQQAPPSVNETQGVPSRLLMPNPRGGRNLHLLGLSRLSVRSNASLVTLPLLTWQGI